MIQMRLLSPVELEPKSDPVITIDPAVFQLKSLLQTKEQPYPSQWAPYPPGASGGGAEGGPPRLQSAESYLVERMGEEAYEEYYKLQEIKLRTPRVDWRFWTGLGCAVIAAGYVAFRA